MKLMPLDQLGPHERPGSRMHFGFLLPWVSGRDGHALFVKVIHEKDQFIKSILPKRFPLTHAMFPIYGDFWSTEILIHEKDRQGPQSHWGEPGRYVYRFELESPLLSAPLDWIVDPYAREYGVGRQSAFTLGYEDHIWGDSEVRFKTPALSDLIVYEVMIHEFSGDLKGAIAKLPYLNDLGVNCLEIMPVANVQRSVDWGFEPIGPFGLDERFGKRRDLQSFVEAAHENNIAIVLDMVYGHTGSAFAYERVYKQLRYTENPFMGPFAKDMFGPSTDYRREFTRDFFFTLNYYWLDQYHLDGIRYDCVPNYYEGCMDEGYANLVYHTYQKVKETSGRGHWQRFFYNGGFHLIQLAEQLEKPIEIVEKTYSNCTWQNETLNAAISVANGNFSHLYQLGMHLGLFGYPEKVSHGSDLILKSAFQYLENHDHARFICRFGTNNLYREVLREGKPENWYRLQPFVIGLLLGKGIPMLWQGQEIVENYDVPDSGPARIGTLRPVRWERFYEEAGKSMLRLMRRLIALRQEESVFRKGSYFFFNDWDRYQSRGLLFFERRFNNTRALVALNFSQYNHDVSFTFPQGGDYKEQLHSKDDLSGVQKGIEISLSIPSNYGRVWLTH